MSTAITSSTPELIAFIMVLVIWETAWKGFALWRAGQRGDSTWFIALLLLNTAGILPITYLLLTKGRPHKSPSRKHKS